MHQAISFDRKRALARYRLAEGISRSRRGDETDSRLLPMPTLLIFRLEKGKASAMGSIERLEYRGSDVTLVADARGPADGLAVLFLHGGGQTRQSWGKALNEAARRG
jgi:hypothetical protein